VGEVGARPLGHVRSAGRFGDARESIGCRTGLAASVCLRAARL